MSSALWAFKDVVRIRSNEAAKKTHGPSFFFLTLLRFYGVVFFFPLIPFFELIFLDWTPVTTETVDLYYSALADLLLRLILFS